MNKESKKKNNSNTLLVIGLLLLFVVIGVGYAALSSVLQINGTANIGRSSWNVHFENVAITSGSVDTDDEPYTASNTTELSYEVDLDAPGDFYEFTVDVVNSGSLAAKLNSTSKTGAEGYPYIVYTVKMIQDNVDVDVPANLELAANGSVKLRVRVEYSRELADATTINNQVPPLDLAYVMNFVQA